MRRSACWTFLILAVSSLFFTSKVPFATAAEGSVLRVAAASDLRFALDEIVSAFKTKHPETTVTVSYGSSGNFFAQITNGAPFDLYFSADAEYPKQLEQKGLIVSESRFVYGIGSLVLFVPSGSPLDLEALGMKAVNESSVKRIAIANPAHAPYGRAAEAALRASGLYEGVRDRLVLGDNVSQAAQFVQTGAADLGIIAYSLALAPPMKTSGRFYRVPTSLHPPLEQVCVILKQSQQRRAAEDFRRFVMGEEGRKILSRYGFEVPEG